MIKFNKLAYSIDKVDVLKGIDMVVEPGQYFAIAGINGAGKSTMMKLILDLLRTDDRSMITIDGKSSWDVTSRDALSYLPEKFQVDKAVTGMQYCRFIYGVYQQPVDTDLIYQLSDQLDFNREFLKKNVSTYSKGMRQKLGLITNFMLNKPLMILDEPLSGLDPKARYCLKQLLLEKRKEGLTLFYSTHMLADAEEVCDQFAILDAGVLKFVGTPQNCREQYNQSSLEAAYMTCISE